MELLKLLLSSTEEEIRRDQRVNDLVQETIRQVLDLHIEVGLIIFVTEEMCSTDGIENVGAWRHHLVCVSSLLFL
jgi:hypothetical protein